MDLTKENPDPIYTMEDMRSYAMACLEKAAENAEVISRSGNSLVREHIEEFAEVDKASITSKDNLI